VDAVRRSADEAGRDPASVEITVLCTITKGEEAVAEVASLRELGATRIIVPAAVFKEDPAESVKRYGADVIGRA